MLGLPVSSLDNSALDELDFECSYQGSSLCPSTAPNHLQQQQESQTRDCIARQISELLDDGALSPATCRRPTDASSSPSSNPTGFGVMKASANSVDMCNSIANQLTSMLREENDGPLDSASTSGPSVWWDAISKAYSHP